MLKDNEGKKGHGQNEDRETATVVPYTGTPLFRYIFKKSERIAAAVHLMTDYISPTEPVRIRLRESALELVRDIRALKGQSTGDTHGHTQGIIARLDELAGLLDVAFSAGITSEMNYTVLTRECGNLAELLHKRAQELIDGHESGIEEHFFTVSDEQTVQPIAQNSPATAQQSQKEHSHKRTKPAHAAQSRTAPGSTVKRKHAARRETILALVRERGRVNVRDVAEVITDCSEKTLQRELLSLVSDGVLNKEGERRWSTYTLASQQ